MSGKEDAPHCVGALVQILDGTCTTPEVLGGKGAALDRLLHWGVHVPPTAIVTADAYRATTAQRSLADLMGRIARHEPIPGDEVEAAFLAARLPEEVRREVVAAARTIGDGHQLAVRSSATVEDLGGSSFAGQYRSMLGVVSDDADALERAVLQVFASLLYPAPRAYRNALGIDSSNIAMAAVLMQMVTTERAGVVFTQDPTLTEPTIRVEVVDGLGESLVSGKRTPRVHQFRRSGSGLTNPTPAPDPELTAIIDTALAIEQHAGCAQDIEWAHDGLSLWIVQARPITAVRTSLVDPFDDDPASLEESEFTTEGIGEMLPGALPPLVWQVAAHMVEDGFRTMLDRLGADVSAAVGPTWLLRRVRGRAALDVNRLGRLMAAIPGADARVRAAYFGEDSPTTPNGDDRATAAPRVAVLAHRRRAGAARRRAIFDAEVVVHAAAALVGNGDDTGPESVSRCSLIDLDDVTLLARQRELVRHAARAMAAELTVSADAGAIHAAVRSLLVRPLGTEPAARWADRVTVPEHAGPTSAAASAAVFAGPTWDELGMTPAAGRESVDRDTLLDELGAALASSKGWPAPGLRRRLARRRLEHLADRASLQFARREQTKAAILVLGGEIRRIHLEVGRRLVAAGLLEEAHDVDLLGVQEMDTLLLQGAGPGAREIDRRRRTHAHHRADPPLPSRWSGPAPDAAPAAHSDGVLTGWAASSGRFIGRARRIDDPRQQIGRDEVLVAAATDPSWSPILLRCGALVLERGGPLSHAAILAREFGVPAVFNIAGAASTLDGRRLLVDGDAGTVTVLDEEASA